MFLLGPIWGTTVWLPLLNLRLYSNVIFDGNSEFTKLLLHQVHSPEELCWTYLGVTHLTRDSLETVASPNPAS